MRRGGRTGRGGRGGRGERGERGGVEWGFVLVVGGIRLLRSPANEIFLLHVSTFLYLSRDFLCALASHF